LLTPTETQNLHSSYWQYEVDENSLHAAESLVRRQ